MNKKQIVSINNKKDMFFRFALLALVLTAFIAFAVSAGILPAFANGAVGGAVGGAGSTSSGVNTATLDSVMNIVIDVISNAAFYIGIVIVLWGAFQIVLAFRREDSEGISKQITTVVVGGVLVGFGAIANNLYNALKGSGGTGI